MTWRETVDNRVKEKTRYFFPAQRKIQEEKGNNAFHVIETHVDEFSTQLVPIIWAPLANNLMLEGSQMDKSVGGIHDLFLAQVLRLLGLLVKATCGTLCPHFVHLATQG